MFGNRKEGTGVTSNAGLPQESSGLVHKADVEYDDTAWEDMMEAKLDRIEKALEGLTRHLGVRQGGPRRSFVARDVQRRDHASSKPEDQKEYAPGARFTGVVQTFDKGWGWIDCKEEKRSFFVHRENVEDRDELSPGDNVEFSVGNSKDGRQRAVEVKRA